ncbi:MAG: FHA domain-containing protein [Myxococcales bacterium]|nr:FHA domain-containing protein [Myxococcales bacterium]
MKGIASLGVMSILGSPTMLKVLPKQLLGNVVKKVATHYLQSGKHLAEAMEEAAQDALTAINMGLNPSFWKTVTKSRVSKEFVELFKANYLEPYFAKFPNLDRAEFAKESDVAIKKILKNLEPLIGDLTPQESDVHEFFSEGEIQSAEKRMNESEALLIRKIHELGEIPPRLKELFRFQHLLFQAILYFFRQKMAQSKEVKAIYEDFQQMHLARSVKDAERQRVALQDAVAETNRQLAELTKQISQGAGAPDAATRQKQLAAQSAIYQEQLTLLREDVLKEARSAMQLFEQELVGFEQRLGSQLEAARGEIRQARLEILDGLDELKVGQSQIKDEMRELRMMMESLIHHVQRGAAESESRQIARTMIRTAFPNQTDSHWQHVLRDNAGRLGLQHGQVEQIIAAGKNSPVPISTSSSQIAQLTRPKVPHAILEVMGREQEDPRTFYIYMSNRVCLGRHSTNDLVLYWYPLPDPPDVHNPEWQNWQGTGACHPALNISSQHLELIWVNGGLKLLDKSSKGTFVNGERLPKGHLVDVSEGSTISPAGVVKLSYTILRDEQAQPIGWRLRRVDNYAGREEYLCVDTGAELTLGGSSRDHLAFSGAGMRGQHLRMRRDGSRILFLPSDKGVHLNGASLQDTTPLEHGVRLEVGEQTIWAFPPN